MDSEAEKPKLTEANWKTSSGRFDEQLVYTWVDFIIYSVQTLVRIGLLSIPAAHSCSNEKHLCTVVAVDPIGFHPC